MGQLEKGELPGPGGGGFWEAVEGGAGASCQPWSTSHNSGLKVEFIDGFK